LTRLGAEALSSGVADITPCWWRIRMPSDSRTKQEIVVQGISASQGIAYGTVFVYLQSDVEVPSYQVDGEKRIEEVARFDKALLTTRQQIAKIQDEVEKNLGEGRSADL